MELVLFDWDGTLVDTRRALLAAWHEVTERVLGRRFPVGPAQTAEAFSRRGHETFARLAPDPETAAALAAGFDAAYARHADEVSAFPGVAELLDDLEAGGLTLAVVTSKTRDRWSHDARRTTLAERFAVVVCAEDVTRGKPDPEPVRLALRRLDVDPAEAVVVGDGPADVQAARRAGVPAVGVSWGFTAAADLVVAGAAPVVGSPGELAAALTGDRATAGCAGGEE